jgi:hypothetical protein
MASFWTRSFSTLHPLLSKWIYLRPCAFREPASRRLFVCHDTAESEDKVISITTWNWAELEPILQLAIVVSQ